MLPVPARAQPLAVGARQEDQPLVSPEAPPWLEPRGMSVVDMVGVVPEDHLRGAMIRYWPGVGVALYESGRREGNTVIVRAKMVTQYRNLVMCLGKPGQRDEWLVIVPESTMKIFDNGIDVTRQLVSDFAHYPAGLILPSAATAHDRYPESKGWVRYTQSGEVLVPANSGCWYWLQNPGSNVVAEFKFQSPRVVSVETLGSQSFGFKSYVGPGYAGLLTSLQAQMDDRFSQRHTYLSFTPPSGTNYIMVRQPIQPVDPYGKDPHFPGGGTYRVRSNSSRLSVDHINAMMIPYYGQWRDADLSGGSDYLRFFNDPVGLSAPEYFVPTGFSYDPCMTNGGCPNSLLDAIYTAEMSLVVYFYRVSVSGSNLTTTPLKQVGPGWSGSASMPTSSVPEAQPQGGLRTFFPAISNASTAPPIDPSLCPCGIFTPDGRMVGFVPR
jgi:hypothetical protein